MLDKERSWSRAQVWANEQTCPRVFAALGPSAAGEEAASFGSSKAGFGFSILWWALGCSAFPKVLSPVLGIQLKYGHCCPLVGASRQWVKAEKNSGFRQKWLILLMEILTSYFSSSHPLCFTGSYGSGSIWGGEPWPGQGCAHKLSFSSAISLPEEVNRHMLKLAWNPWLPGKRNRNVSLQGAVMEDTDSANFQELPFHQFLDFRF